MAGVLHRWAIAACALLAAAGCSSPVEAPVDSALKKIDPAAFQATVESAADKLGVPGSVALVVTPQGRYVATTGTTELGTNTPPTADTHFRIASNTKTMTSAVILLLAQDGKLHLTDPVSTYLPDVPNGEQITVADLLRMRSGLYDYTKSDELASDLDADPAKAFTPQQMLALAFKRPPNFAPNASYEYNNTNYVLLGLIAEKLGGRPLAELFQQRLFGPLGLPQTSLPATDDTTMPPPYSHGYMYGETAFALQDRDYSPDMAAAARGGTLKPVDYTNQNPSYATAAGGAISTASDLADWIAALAVGKVFNADYQKQWLDSLMPEDASQTEGKQYGYGIAYQRFGTNASMYYHGGELPGFNSFMGHDVDNDVTLVIWTNLTLSPEGKTTANALLPTILDQIYTHLNF